MQRATCFFLGNISFVKEIVEARVAARRRERADQLCFEVFLETRGSGRARHIHYPEITSFLNEKSHAYLLSTPMLKFLFYFKCHPLTAVGFIQGIYSPCLS